MSGGKGYEAPGIAGSGAIATGLAAVSTTTADTILLARSEASAWRAEEKVVAACAKIEGAEPSRLRVTTNPADLSDCDVIVEAIVEEVEPKGELLSTIAEACPDSDLATTTSSLSIGAIAAAAGTDRLYGLHVFNPVPRMKLVEVCFPDGAAGSREKALAWCAALGKTAVEVPDQAGFVVNRLLFPYLFEAVRLIERTGMEAGEVDTCMKLGAGHPMGPLALLDFVGLDVSQAIGDALFAENRRGRQQASGNAGRVGRRRKAGPQVRRRLLRIRLALTGQVPDHVRLGDPLAAGGIDHLVPGQLGLWKLIPARQVERLDGAFQGRTEMLLGSQQRPQHL